MSNAYQYGKVENVLPYVNIGSVRMRLADSVAIDVVKDGGFLEVAFWVDGTKVLTLGTSTEKQPEAVIDAKGQLHPGPGYEDLEERVHKLEKAQRFVENSLYDIVRWKTLTQKWLKSGGTGEGWNSSS